MYVSSPIPLRQLPPNLPSPLPQILRLNHRPMFAEAEHPSLHFLQIVQRHCYPQRPIRPVRQLLARMPTSAPAAIEPAPGLRRHNSKYQVSIWFLIEGIVPLRTSKNAASAGLLADLPTQNGSFFVSILVP